MPLWTSQCQAKPTTGTLINWANPITTTLQYAIPFNDPWGIPHEIASSPLNAATLTKTGAPSWITEQYGYAINFAAQTNYYALPAWNPTTITLLVLVKGGDGTTGSNTWWSRNYDGTSVPWAYADRRVPPAACRSTMEHGITLTLPLTHTSRPIAAMENGTS